MRTVVFPMFLLALLAAPATADDWSQSFAVAGTPNVRLQANEGSVKVSSGAFGKVEASVHAVGYTRGRDYDVQVNQSGNRVEVNVRRRGGPFGWLEFGGTARRSIEVRLLVPRSTNLDLSSGDGGVTADDIAGTIRITTGDGSIQVRRLSGSIELRTGDGQVTAEAAEGSLQAHTGDGSITARGRFQELNLESGDGQVDVRVEDGSAMQRSWSVRTGNGSVSLALPASFAADLDVVTQDGHIASDFPGNPRRDSSRFQARLNSGTHLLTIRTGDGSITIRKR